MIGVRLRRLAGDTARLVVEDLRDAGVRAEI
jgi:hypothetical protein